MKYTFVYSKIMERCKMLSSYEGREHTSGSGESLYESVKITEQDEPLVTSYIEQSARKLENMMERMITDVVYNPSGFEWTLRTEEARTVPGSSFNSNVEDAVVGYTMMMWLTGRKDNSVGVYKQIWEDASALCVKGAFRKKAPVRGKKYSTIDNDEHEEDWI